MKRPTISILAGVTLFVLLASGIGGTIPGAEARTFLQFGGSSPGGVFYYLFGVLTTLLTEKMPGTIATNVATGASVDNLKRLIKGEVDFGMSRASNI